MAFPLQMMQKTYKCLSNVQYEWQIIVVKILIDAFGSSSLESMVLALVS
jgi:hypothetical protein